MKVSVIIPVYNDSEGIGDTLTSVLKNSSRSLEIIVVDNGSTDETPSKIREFTDTHAQVIMKTEAEIQGSYAARNTGIEHASGAVLVFLDADQTVTEGWLETGIAEMKAKDAHYLAPDVDLVLPDDPALASRYNHRTGFPIRDFIERQGFAPTACLFVTRELIDDVGVFDDRLISGGDKEFGNRVHDAGYKLHYTSELVIHHPTRNSFRSLIKRNLRIGRGHCQLQQYYPDRYGRMGIPPRPSGIHGDQVRQTGGEPTHPADQSGGLIERVLLGVVAAVMTGVRGIGYYRYYVSLLLGRAFR